LCLRSQGELVRERPWPRSLAYVSMTAMDKEGPRLPLGAGQHVVLFGATGAGKTTSARRLIAARTLAHHSALLVLDQKGDTEDVEHMKQLAARAGVPFVLFDSQDPNGRNSVAPQRNTCKSMGYGVRSPPLGSSVIAVGVQAARSSRCPAPGDVAHVVGSCDCCRSAAALAPAHEPFRIGADVADDALVAWLSVFASSGEGRRAVGSVQAAADCTSSGSGRRRYVGRSPST
jgi:Type IV secretion-system coupling protein DNA-binding domain